MTSTSSINALRPSRSSARRDTRPKAHSPKLSAWSNYLNARIVPLERLLISSTSVFKLLQPAATTTVNPLMATMSPKPAPTAATETSKATVPWVSSMSHLPALKHTLTSSPATQDEVTKEAILRIIKLAPKHVPALVISSPSPLSLEAWKVFVDKEYGVEEPDKSKH